MKKRSFILVAVALLLTLAMAITGCAAATDSGPTTEAVNNDTIILDKNAVFTIEGVIQAFAEGYDPVYFVGEKTLLKTDVDFLNARSFVPAGKTLVITTYASRAGGTSIGTLTMDAIGETLKVAGNLTVKSDIAGLNPSFALNTGAIMTVGGNFEVGKLGAATIAGTVTQTSGSKISVAGGAFTLAKGATWTVQRKSETEAAPGIDIDIAKDSVVEILAPIVIGSGNFTIASRSGGVINDAPSVYIAAIVTGDENSTATLGTNPVYGAGGAIKIANKIGADGTVSVTTKVSTTKPVTADWAGIDTIEYAPAAADTELEAPAGKTFVIAGDVDAGAAEVVLTGNGTFIIPEGVTVKGSAITLGHETTGGEDPTTTPTLVVNGSFIGTITSEVTGGGGAALDYPHIVLPSQGLEFAIGDNESIEIDKDGYLVVTGMFSVTRELLVPSTAKFDLEAVSGSKVGAASKVIIQKGAKIKQFSNWFGTGDTLDAEMAAGAQRTYIITFDTSAFSETYAEPSIISVEDTAGTVYES